MDNGLGFLQCARLKRRKLDGWRGDTALIPPQRVLISY